MDLDTYCISRHTFYLSLVFAEDSDLGEGGGENRVRSRRSIRNKKSFLSLLQGRFKKTTQDCKTALRITSIKKDQQLSTRVIKYILVSLVIPWSFLAPSPPYGLGPPKC